MSNFTDVADRFGDLGIDTPADAQAKPTSTNWGAIVSLMLGVFGLVTAEFLPISLLTPMAADLGVSVSAAGQAVTATAIVGGLAAIVTAILTRNIDRRIVVWGLLAMLVASSLIAATATSYASLLVARILLGVGLGGFWSMVGAIALRLATPGSVPRAMSIIFAGVSAATVTAAPLGAYMGDVWGWRSAFYLATAIGVVALFVQLLTMPRLRPDLTPSFGAMFGLLRRRQVVLGFVALLLLISGHFAGFTYIRPFLEQAPQFGVQAISLVLLAFGVAGFVGTLLAGPILARSVRIDLTIGALAISAMMFALASFGASTVVAVGAVALWGMAFGLIPVGFQTWAVKAAPNDTEAIGGLIVAAFQIAITLGAALGGVFVSGYGVSGAVVYAMAATLGAGLIFSLYRGIDRAG